MLPHNLQGSANDPLARLREGPLSNLGARGCSLTWCERVLSRTSHLSARGVLSHLGGARCERLSRTSFAPLCDRVLLHSLSCFLPESELSRSLAQGPVPGAAGASSCACCTLLAPLPCVNFSLAIKCEVTSIAPRSLVGAVCMRDYARE